MIAVVSGTNRPDSNTLKIARVVTEALAVSDADPTLLDLSELPAELFTPEAYAAKPPAFEPFQQAILDADGVLVVVPEYNGSFPGVLKVFIDMLRFPESLYETPAGFVGLSAGTGGAVRAVEQLEMVFQYRHAHLYGRRCFLPGIHKLLDSEGRLVDPRLHDRLTQTIHGFTEFCHRLAA